MLLATTAQADMLIDDFTNDPEDRWRFVSDRVMGGVSEGSASIGGDPAHIRLTGDVSTENNGGFVQVRRDLDPWPADTVSVTLRVRGDGQAYFVALRTTDARRPWHSYRARFVAPADWTDITIPLDQFEPSRDGLPPLDVTRMKSMGILAYGRDHEADLSVARIEIR